MAAWQISQLENDSTIILMSLGRVTWTDYHQAFDEAFAVAKGIDSRADIILYTEDPLPAGAPFQHFKHTANIWGKYPNVKLLVVVMKLPAFSAKIANIALKMAAPWLQLRVHYVTSMETAFEILRKDRANAQSA